MTFWKTAKYSINIETVEVARSTESSVFIVNAWTKREQRSARMSEYDQYHETEAAAVAYLRDRLKGKVEYAEGELESAREKLAKFEAKYGGAA